MGESSRIIIRKLTKQHLQSVVSLKVKWNGLAQQVRQQTTCKATGFIIHTCPDFISILTCSHTFKPFSVSPAPEYDSVAILNSNTDLQVGFFDGSESCAAVQFIDWWQDLCLVVVAFPEKSSYAPVTFADAEEDINRQSIYSRGAKVYSIFCVPTDQPSGKLLFGTAVKGDICGRNDIIGDDLGPVYHSDLRFFEFNMVGPLGCSGAPVFNQDLLVIGMRMAKVEDIMFGLKLNQIREWACTWFNIGSARSMKEVIARASDCMSRELQEIVEAASQFAELGLDPVEAANQFAELGLDPVEASNQFAELGVDPVEYSLDDLDL